MFGLAEAVAQSATQTVDTTKSLLTAMLAAMWWVPALVVLVGAVMLYFRRMTTRDRREAMPRKLPFVVRACMVIIALTGVTECLEHLQTLGTFLHIIHAADWVNNAARTWAEDCRATTAQAACHWVQFSQGATLNPASPGLTAAESSSSSASSAAAPEPFLSSAPLLISPAAAPVSEPVKAGESWADAYRRWTQAFGVELNKHSTMWKACFVLSVMFFFWVLTHPDEEAKREAKEGKSTPWYEYDETGKCIATLTGDAAEEKKAEWLDAQRSDAGSVSPYSELSDRSDYSDNSYRSDDFSDVSRSDDDDRANLYKDLLAEQDRAMRDEIRDHGTLHGQRLWADLVEEEEEQLSDGYSSEAAYKEALRKQARRAVHNEAVRECNALKQLTVRECSLKSIFWSDKVSARLKIASFAIGALVGAKLGSEISKACAAALIKSAVEAVQALPVEPLELAGGTSVLSQASSLASTEAAVTATSEPAVVPPPVASYPVGDIEDIVLARSAVEAVIQNTNVTHVETPVIGPETPVKAETAVAPVRSSPKGKEPMVPVPIPNKPLPAVPKREAVVPHAPAVSLLSPVFSMVDKNGSHIAFATKVAEFLVFQKHALAQHAVAFVVDGVKHDLPTPQAVYRGDLCFATANHLSVKGLKTLSSTQLPEIGSNVARMSPSQAHPGAVSKFDYPNGHVYASYTSQPGDCGTPLMFGSHVIGIHELRGTAGTDNGSCIVTDEVLIMVRRHTASSSNQKTTVTEREARCIK
jgi:hypothetical protein